MSSAYATTRRLIAERIERLIGVASTLDDLDESAQVVRLAAGALALLQQHTIDGKGRCRLCTQRRWWHRIRSRPCTVYAAFSAYLTQPDELMHRQITELMHRAAPRKPLPERRRSRT